jgi:hypothetical protein
VVDGIDARVHHMEFVDPARLDEVRRGMIAGAAPAVSGPRPSDRNIAMVANDAAGIYKPRWHVERIHDNFERHKCWSYASSRHQGLQLHGPGGWRWPAEGKTWKFPRLEWTPTMSALAAVKHEPASSNQSRAIDPIHQIWRILTALFSFWSRGSLFAQRATPRALRTDDPGDGGRSVALTFKPLATWRALEIRRTAACAFPAGPI